MSDKKLTFDVGVKLDPTILKAQSTVLKTQLQAATLEAVNFDKELKKVVADIARVKMNPEQFRSLTQARHELERIQKAASGISSSKGATSALTTVASAVGIGGLTSKLAGLGGLVGPEGALAGAAVGLVADIGLGVAGMLKSAGEFILDAMKSGERQNILQERIKREFEGSATAGYDKAILETAKKMAALEGVTKAEALQGILPLARELDEVQIGSTYVDRKTGQRKVIKNQAEADRVKEAQLNDPLGLVRQAADLSVLNGQTPRANADNINRFLEAYTAGKNGGRQSASAANTLIDDLNVPKARKIIEEAQKGTLASSKDLSDQNKRDLEKLGVNLHKALAGDEVLMALRLIAGEGIDAADLQRKTIDFSLKKLYATISDSLTLFGQDILEDFGFGGKSGKNPFDMLREWLESSDGKEAIAGFAKATATLAREATEFVTEVLPPMLAGFKSLAKTLAWLFPGDGNQPSGVPISEGDARKLLGQPSVGIPALTAGTPGKYDALQNFLNGSAQPVPQPFGPADHPTNAPHEIHVHVTGPANGDPMVWANEVKPAIADAVMDGIAKSTKAKSIRSRVNDHWGD